MPEYSHTGQSTYFASTCRECPAACGIVVRTMEGRAIKIEGNPSHPVNQGRLCSRGVAGVQGLYNPDRIQGPRKQNGRGSGKLEKIDWDTAVGVVKSALQNTPSDQIAFLFGTVPDHLFALASELTTALGAPAPLRFSALSMLESRYTLMKATEVMLGASRPIHFDLAEADVAFVFGADLVGTWLSPVYFNRAYGRLRQGHLGRRGYVVVFDPHQSLTASNADEWVPVKPGTEVIVAQALGKLVAEARSMEVPPAFQPVDIARAAEISGVDEARLRHLAGLFASAARPLAIPGGNALGHTNGQATAEAVLALDVLVDNLGKTGGVYQMSYTEFSSPALAIRDLVVRMANGQVKALFIHGINPVFELPPSLGFSQALSKVPLVVSFASFPDETAGQADYILPDHTSLESWGFQGAVTGTDRLTLTSSQPVVVPLYETRATADVLLAAVQAVGGDLATKVPYHDEVEFLQQKLPVLIGKGGVFDASDIKTFWAQWLQTGGWWTEQPGALVPKSKDLSQPLAAPAASAPPDGYNLQLITYATMLGDGSGANRPWLQETPNPLTTAMWNSWVEINPDTADKLGVVDDDIVKVTSPYGEVEAIVYRYPAIHPDVVAIPFGQGHTALGRYAKDRGCNPAALLPATFNEAGDLAYADTWVKISPTGKKKQLARAENRIGIYGDH